MQHHRMCDRDCCHPDCTVAKWRRINDYPSKRYVRNNEIREVNEREPEI